MTKKLFSALLIFACVNFVQAQLSWQQMATAPKSYRLDDFHFINPRQGWAISPNYAYLSSNKPGQIFKTNDGGVNWQMLVNNSPTFFRAIGFADSLTGWVGNLGDSTVTNDTVPLYHTNDGGTTWQPVTNIPSPRPKGICGISVVTDSIIYAYGRYYGPPVLLKTIDKGTTWTSTNMSPYASGLVDAHFFNKDTGFITGCIGNTATQQQQALILSTFDGGATWQTRHTSTRPSEEVWKIFFPSRNIGYASIEYQNRTSVTNIATYFLKTTDGGLTWVDMPFMPASPNTFYDLEGIGFINDTIGWIGGDACSPTYKTTDGGTTWNPDPSFGLRTAFPDCGNTYTGVELNRFRKFGDTLMYASGCTVFRLSAPLVPIPHFHASTTVACAGAIITFADSTINTNVTSWQWNFPGGTLVSGYTLSDSMPKVTYTATGMYTVSYTATNSKGSASVTKTNYINILSSTAAYNSAFTESFETTTIPGTDWNVFSTASKNFAITNTAAATGLKSVMLDNFANSPADTSFLISPTFNLAAIGSPILKFKMAYQQKATTNVDRLQIFSSIDCGITWVSRFVRSGTALQPATVAGQSTLPFTPTPAQFATYTVNINAIASSTNAMFRFVFFADQTAPGNNIYIDDINIYNSTIGIKNIETNMDVEIYPNPAQNNFTIETNTNQKQTLQLFDVNGKLVLTQTINDKAIVDVSNLSSGVYNLSITNNVGVANKRLVIVK